MVWELLNYGADQYIHFLQKNKIGMPTTQPHALVCNTYEESSLKMFNMREHGNSWTAPATSNMGSMLEVLANTFWMATITLWIGTNTFWMGRNTFRKYKNIYFFTNQSFYHLEAMASLTSNRMDWSPEPLRARNSYTTNAPKYENRNTRFPTLQMLPNIR